MCDANDYVLFQEKLKALNETMTYMTLQLSAAMRMALARMPELLNEFNEVQQMAEQLGISAQ